MHVPVGVSGVCGGRALPPSHVHLRPLLRSRSKQAFRGERRLGSLRVVPCVCARGKGVARRQRSQLREPAVARVRGPRRLGAGASASAASAGRGCGYECREQERVRERVKGASAGVGAGSGLKCVCGCRARMRVRAPMRVRQLERPPRPTCLRQAE